MNIINITSWTENLALKRPYKIATRMITDVQNVFVQLELDDGTIGLGSASPSENVTGESIAECAEALSDDNLQWLIGQDINDYQTLCEKISAKPAATAAIDIALHDAYAKIKNRPLVDILGRKHDALPTSITVGIKNVADTLTEAQEYVDRGFTVIKVKLGDSVEEDIERIIKLNEKFADIILRVDMNQGYDLLQFNHFLRAVNNVNIELIEQPFPVSQFELLNQIDPKIKKKIALDENLKSDQDAEQFKKSCGIFNIKLMKCGGIYRAQKIIKIAEKNNVELMWGCNDESRISIAAALHVAFSSRRTKYIDLDGSFDLATDVVSGGFTLENGVMRVVETAGLGVEDL